MMPLKSDSKSDDHTRLAIVETKVEYIEGAVKRNEQALTAIDEKVDNISTHIAQQNGTLPYLKENSRWERILRKRMLSM